MSIRSAATLAALSAVASILVLSGPAGCALPAGSSGDVVVRTDEARVEVAFTAEDRALIHEYYRANLPPGLARKGLPPGHRKRLVRKGQLPPGIAKRALPADLDRRLSPLPQGYARILVDTDVFLVDIATDLILDIVRDVGR
jgi:hypothetical protein